VSNVFFKALFVTRTKTLGNTYIATQIENKLVQRKSQNPNKNVIVRKLHQTRIH
jgi:hypothetical protein